MFVYFPAVKGQQGSFTCYSVQVPFTSLQSSFIFDDDTLPVDQRCQREINISRAKRFANYINDNPETFVTGAVVGTVDDSVEFIPLEGPFSNGEIGMLKVPSTYRIILCDGQHRQKGIEIAMEANAGANNTNTLPIILYEAEGVERKQQIFADINSTSVKPSNSLAMTFDHRSNFVSFVKGLAKKIPYLSSCIEFEKSSVSSNSTRLWPLISFKKFIVNLTGLSEANFDKQITCDKSKLLLETTVISFIEGLDNLNYWYEITRSKKNLKEIRQDMIVAHAVFLEALGLYGFQLMQKFDAQGAIDWRLMMKLSEVPVDKAYWVGRCLSPQMTIVKNQFGINSTASKLCSLTDTPLSEALAEAENKVA